MKSAWRAAASAAGAEPAGTNPAGGTRSHCASATTMIRNPMPKIAIVAGTPRAWISAFASGAMYTLDRPNPDTTRPVIRPVLDAGNHFTAAGVADAWHAPMPAPASAPNPTM